MQLKIPETHNHSSGYKILKLSFYSIILLHGIFIQFQCKLEPSTIKSLNRIPTFLLKTVQPGAVN